MLLRWLVSAVGLAALKGEASAIARRVTIRASLTALGAVLWLTALGFAVAALAVLLSAELGVIPACAIIAGGLAVVGLAILVGLRLGAGRRRRRMPKPLAGLSSGLGGSPGADIGGLGSLAVIAIAGYLLGRQLFRR
jgi:hypothetical protein